MHVYAPIVGVFVPAVTPEAVVSGSLPVRVGWKRGACGYSPGRAASSLFSETTPLVWGPVHLQLPAPNSLNLAASVIAAVAALLIFRFRFWALRTIGVCAVLGLAAGVLGLPLG